MGSRIIIPTGAQTILNFLIIRMERLNTINGLPADMQTGLMHCKIGENPAIFCIHVINAIMK